MPQIITYLTQNGVPEHMLVWIFMLPIALTLAVIGRQIIGIKGFSISAPILIGFAFSAIGLQSGVIIFITILGAGFLMKLILGKIRLLYLPKMALILLGTIIAVTALMPVLPYKTDIQFSFVAFAFLILILSTEQFSSLFIEQGPRKTLGAALETLLMSTTIFFLIEWSWLQDTVLAYPLFVVIAALLINLFLGKWTGLRVSEYIRFKDIIFK